MATDLARLVVRMEANSAKLVKDLEKSKRETARWRKKVTRDVTGVTRAFKGMVSAAAIAAFSKQVLNSTRQQEQALAQLRQGYESTGGVVGLTVEQMIQDAEELQKVSLFGDEQIIEAQSQLITFTNIVEDEFFRATRAALDLSTRMGTDLKSSVIQLGKVLNDPSAQLSALARSGIQFNDEQREMIRNLQESGDLIGAQTIVLEELERQFGGSAKAARETFGGALTGLSNAVGDLLEGKDGDGKGLEEARLQIEELTATLQDPMTVKAIQDSIGLLVTYFTTLVTLGPRLVGYAEELVEKLQPIVDPTGSLTGFLKDAMGIPRNEGGDKPRGQPLITVTRGNDGVGSGSDFTDPRWERELGIPQTGYDAALDREIEYWAKRHEEAQKAAEIQKDIERDILATKMDIATQSLDLIASTAKDGSALQKVAFIAARSMAAVQAVINAELAATAALAPPPIGLGPVAGVGLATTVRTLGYASAAIIAAQAISSFDGGGYTGPGSRTGGIDGKGGFMAIMHPDETVIDHKKGGSAGPMIVQNNDFRGSSLNEAQVREMIDQGNQALEYKIKRDLAR